MTFSLLCLATNICIGFKWFDYKFRLEDWSYCDSEGNCLLFGSYFPLLSFTISFLSFLTSTLDSLQPDTIQEITQVVAFTFNNLALRVLALVISLTFLGKKNLNLKKFELSKTGLL